MVFFNLFAIICLVLIFWKSYCFYFSISISERKKFRFKKEENKTTKYIMPNFVTNAFPPSTYKFVIPLTLPMLNNFFLKKTIVFPLPSSLDDLASLIQYM